MPPVSPQKRGRSPWGNVPELQQLFTALQISFDDELKNPSCPNIATAKASVESVFASADKSAVIADLKRAIGSQALLHALLRPITRSDAKVARNDSGGSGPSKPTSAAFSISQDSTIKLLLSVSGLQRELCDLLLEQIPALQYETHSSQESSNARSAVNVPKLILSQFQWLDCPMNYEHVTGKMLEVMDVCEPDVQRDIVSLLPEVVPEIAKKAVVSKLLDVMTDSSSMTTSVLEALGNISLGPTETDNIVENVRRFLPSAQQVDLPVILRFLLLACDASNMIDTIMEVRSSITLESPASKDKDVEPIVSPNRSLW